MFQATIDDVVNNFLRERVNNLSVFFDSDIITIFSPMSDGLDFRVRQYIEDIADDREVNQTPSKDSLLVFLETTGGSIEVVERIVNIFRSHYTTVKFIIPGFAYSAGTVLVLSGDEIFMDGFSVLGPIDPQIRNKDGDFMPATGYLHEYRGLINTINEKSNSGTPATAEINYLISSFSPEKLAFIEQHIEFSKNLIVDWLPKYKFKDWHSTDSNSIPVTPDMKTARALEIATILGDVNRWHMHGRGIGLKELASEEIKLKINNFSNDKDLNIGIRMYYDVLKDYLIRTSGPFALHGSRGLTRLN